MTYKCEGKGRIAKRDPRKRELPGFTLVLIILIMLNARNVNAFDAGTEFQSRTGGGYISFASDFNVTSNETQGNMIFFYGFNNSDGTFGDVGFDIPAGVNISVTNITTANITQSVTYWADALYRAYTPDQGLPLTITGGNGWTYDNTTISVNLDETETVVILWVESWYVENDTYAEPTTNYPDLSNQYLPLGDLSGFIIAPYTMVMGVMFFPVLFLMFVLPSYQRLGLMITGVLVILFWTSLEAALSPQTINIVNILLRIGLAGVLVYLTWARRGQRG